MGRLHLGIEPGDVSPGVFPGQAHRRPARRLILRRRIGEIASLDLPAQAQDRIAGRGLIAAGMQEGEKLRAGDVVLSQREGFDGHDMLGAFGIKTARRMRRASHQEFSRRDRHHLRTAGTFAEGVGVGRANPDQRRQHDRERQPHQARAAISMRQLAIRLSTSTGLERKMLSATLRFSAMVLAET